VDDNQNIFYNIIENVVNALDILAIVCLSLASKLAEKACWGKHFGTFIE
jgi:hypothetical protein